MTIRGASEDEGVVLGELKFLSLQRSINNFQPNSVLPAARQGIGSGEQLQ